MTFSQCFAVVAYVIYAALAGSLFLRKKNMVKKAGTCLLPISIPAPKLFPVAMIAVPVLITLVLLVPMELSMGILMCGCALLAEEIVIKEYLANICGGVYEKAVLASSRIIQMDDIKSLPTLAYEDDPEAVSLRVVCQKKGILVIEFPNPAIRKSAIEKILSVRPDLKP